MEVLRFTIDHDIDSVFTRLTDPDYVVARWKAAGAREASCEVERENGVVRLHIEFTGQKDPSEVPKIMRKFSLKQTIRMDVRWWGRGGDRVGTVVAHPGSLPVSVEDDRCLRATASGCELTIEQRCKVHIPLVARRLEKRLLARRAEDLAHEVDYLCRELAR